MNNVKHNSEKLVIEDLCDSLIDLQHSFKELHGVGVISIHTDDIHVEEDYLLKIPGYMREVKHKNSSYPWEAWKMYKGVKFFSISKERLTDGRVE